MEKAIEFCSDVLDKGVASAIEDRVVDYVTDDVWSEFATGWNTTRCQALASFAQDILSGRDKIHHSIGELGVWAMKAIQDLLPFGFGRRTEALQRALARKLAEAIPVPGITDHLTVIGRGLQILGIVLCSLQDYDIARCACFEDMLNEQGKQMTKGDHRFSAWRLDGTSRVAI